MRCVLFGLFALVLILGCVPQIHAGWGETTEVRVLDGHYRALPNAMANITWEISKSRGLATTKNKLTGANGRTTFQIQNNEYANEDTNYTYTVQVSYGKASGSAQFNYSIGETPRTIDLPVYWVTFRALDGNGVPVPGMKLYIENWPVLTIPASGLLSMPLDAGKHTLAASIGSFSQSIPFEVKDDMLVDITARFYDVSVQVLDDAGKPIRTDVNVGDMKQASDAQGEAKFANVTDPNPLLTIYYGRYKKSLTLNLSERTDATVIFDTHPPQIRNIRADWNGQTLKIQAVIQDTGDYASGLRDNNASIDLYYIDKNSVQKKVPMYAVGYNLYEGAIPLDSSVPTVRYIVQATDAEGNSISSSDTFAVPTSDNGSGASQLNPPIEPGSAGGIDWLMVAGLVLGVGVLAAAAYGYYKNKKSPTEETDENPYLVSSLDMEGAPEKNKPRPGDESVPTQPAPAGLSASPLPSGAARPATPPADKKTEAKPPPLPPGAPPKKS